MIIKTPPSESNHNDTFVYPDTSPIIYKIDFHFFLTLFLSLINPDPLIESLGDNLFKVFSRGVGWFDEGLR